MNPPAEQKHDRGDGALFARLQTFEYGVGGMTVKVPTGCMFTHIIRGGGRKITYQNAGVDCAFVGALRSGFCN